jgi:hypothetical protein
MGASARINPENHEYFLISIMNQRIGTIFILTPDVQFPSGGVNRLHRYGHYLRQAGYKVFMLHGDRSRGGYSHSRFEVPIAYLGEIGIPKSGDVLLIPEVFGGSLGDLIKFPCHKILVSLSWLYVFNPLPDGTHWKKLGYSRVLTTCRTIADFLKVSMDLDAGIVPTSVDGQLFRYRGEAKKNQICHLSRKDQDSATLLKILRSDPGAFGLEGWNMVAIQNMKETEYASVLRESAIFLTTTHQEGVPGPILEALASGCEVVGYGGPSGSEFCEQEASNGTLNVHFFEPGNYTPVLNWFKTRKECRDRVKQSTHVLKTYTVERERDALLQYFDSL